MKSWAAKTILFFLIIAITYTFIVIIPNQKRTQDLLDLQSFLTPIHTSLLENHLSLNEISRLDPADSEFEAQQTRLLDRLTTSRQSTLTALDNNSPDPDLTSLFDETKTLLESQSDLIANYHPDSPELEAYLTTQADLLKRYLDLTNEIKADLKRLSGL